MVVSNFIIFESLLPTISLWKHKDLLRLYLISASFLIFSSCFSLGVLFLFHSYYFILETLFCVIPCVDFRSARTSCTTCGGTTRPSALKICKGIYALSSESLINRNHIAREGRKCPNFVSFFFSLKKLSFFYFPRLCRSLCGGADPSWPLMAAMMTLLASLSYNSL